MSARPDLRLLVLVPATPERPVDPGAVGAMLDGGATALQLRAKGLDPRKQAAAAELLIALARPRGVGVFVNDRADIAGAVGADGAHLGPLDPPPERVRPWYEGFLGVSARTPERAAGAERAGADYLGAGALRASSTKPEAPVVGIEGIASVIAAVRIPVVAIGGIRPEDARALRGVGASGMAVQGRVVDADDPGAAAAAFRRAWDD